MKQNSILLGIILGTITPILTYALLLELYDFLATMGAASSEGFSFNFRKRTVAILAICSNLIPFTFFNRKRATNSLRGVMIPTLIFAGLWIYNYSEALFTD